MFNKKSQDSLCFFYINSPSSKKSIQPSVHTLQNKETVNKLIKNMTITNNNDVNDDDIKHILNQLINNENPSYYGNNINIQSRTIHPFNKNTKNINDFRTIDSYKNKIIILINQKFYNDTSFSGKKCILHTQLLMNGTLKIISPPEGDPTLCQAAIFATKLTKLPIPPNSEIYKKFKNITLNFSP